ncbi:Rho guanine nucleotide exchange factor [Marasmius sp. AFHP31]|nr:Rho guanine nucleotide exchange factor [Marasmius sp. AFHP31]
MDLASQIDRLEHVYRSKPKCRALDSRRGQSAEKSLDLLQLLIDHPDLSNRLRSKVCSTMLHISKKTGFHPKCLVIENVEVVGKHPVGGGGYADIWKGRLGKSLVCLKILRVFKEPEVQQVLKECMPEAVLWKQLRHPNVLPFLGFFLDTSGRPCLVSPWMENGNLTEYINSADPAFSQRVLLAFDVASGLAYLHEKDIVHGDLKGLNVLITPDLRACISDFGLSIVAESSLRFSNTSSASPRGTTRYQAPEIVRCDILKPTKESDVYSYGCLAYEVFTGRLPLYQVKPNALLLRIMNGARPERPTDIPNLQLSDELWTVMEECWKTEPPERPCAGVLRARLVEIRSIGFRDIPPTTQNGSEISRELWEQVYSPHLLGADINTFIATLKMTEALDEKPMLRRGFDDEFDGGAPMTVGSSTSGPSTPTTPAGAKVDVRKIFQNHSSMPSPQTPSDKRERVQKEATVEKEEVEGNAEQEIVKPVEVDVVEDEVDLSSLGFNSDTMHALGLSATPNQASRSGAHSPRNASPLGEIDLSYTPPPSISGPADRDRPRRRRVVVEEEEEDQSQSQYPTRFSPPPLPSAPPKYLGVKERLYDDFEREISWVASPAPQSRMPIDDDDDDGAAKDEYELEAEQAYDDRRSSPHSSGGFYQHEVYDDVSPQRVSSGFQSVGGDSETSLDITPSYVPPSPLPLAALSGTTSISRESDGSVSPTSYPTRLSVASRIQGIPSLPLSPDIGDLEGRPVTNDASSERSADSTSTSTWEKVKYTFRSRSKSSLGRRSRNNSTVTPTRKEELRENAASSPSISSPRRLQKSDGTGTFAAQPVHPPTGLSPLPSASKSMLLLSPTPRSQSSIPPSIAGSSKYQNAKLFPFTGMRKLEERNLARGPHRAPLPSNMGSSHGPTPTPTTTTTYNHQHTPSSTSTLSTLADSILRFETSSPQQQAEPWSKAPTKYTVVVIHPCRLPAPVSYRGFPFLTLGEGENFEVLHEAGHPGLYRKLPLYVDDGEDCLLLCRRASRSEAEREIGWALASFLESVEG